MPNSYKRPALNMSTEEAKSELYARMQAGMKLLPKIKESPDFKSIVAVRLDFNKWDEYNTSLLQNIFYDSSVFRHYLSIDNSLTYVEGAHQESKTKFTLLLIGKINALESLLEQVSAGLFEKVTTQNEIGKGKVNEVALLDEHESWQRIESQYKISKKQFGKKINFIKDAYLRKVIFRDVEDAFSLASLGYSKPAVLLAGGVIEELLRQFLIYQNIQPADEKFEEYIKACQENGLLKKSVSQLSDSVRLFRNLVHLQKESKLRQSVSKPTAAAVLASIFILADDF